ncbi:nucleoside kinase [Palleniella muris]|uniref:Nucleoside kinase n=1 Tax=Palleniella muris TaxID=3038145 RepID=A0AC61QNV5_9BACT|nr:nucleoside kinase [Palleniella muris]TGX81501.1 nucleoside kinase [Palleniella muris]
MNKIRNVIEENARWRKMLGLSTIEDLNNAISKGHAKNLIQVSEALQEKEIVKIADRIAQRQEVRTVLLAGPSSSGKTTTSKRLSIQLIADGIWPVPISLDDYFLDRHLTPRDENGDYDFECLGALNVELLNEHLNALFRGKEVELPRYDFKEGRSLKSGNRLQLKGNEVLIFEGIHALNPALTCNVPQNQIFRLYASALVSNFLDDGTRIPTSDNRLLRRILRDVRQRGVSAAETIRRWPSVRAGEEKWIFPYQENADAVFNTAMLFELAVMKTQGERALNEVLATETDTYITDVAKRLLGWLAPISSMEMAEKDIPPTSLLREFLGGSSFEY